MAAGHGYGTTVEFNSVDMDLIDVDGPGFEQSTIDVTHMESTDKWREFIDGMRDAGEVTLTVHHDPSIDVKANLIEAGKNTLTVTWPIVDSTNTTNGTWAADAICTGYSPGAEIDERMTAEVTFKMSGVPTITAEAA